MSDDTPTQRFPSQGDGVEDDLQEEKQKSKGLLIGLVIAGVLLLVTILVLVFVLGRANGSPDAAGTETAQPTISAIPSETPDASPTPTEEPDEPAPPPSGPAITSFTVTPGTVYCNTQAPVQPQNQYLSMSWTTTGADEIRIGTYDPYGDYSVRYYDLPPNGNQNAIGQDIIYQCPEATQTWRLEIIADGQTYQKEVTIHNDGDQQ
jgi:flagellar basal body-associated protein FliL